MCAIEDEYVSLKTDMCRKKGICAPQKTNMCHGSCICFER